MLSNKRNQSIGFFSTHLWLNSWTTSQRSVLNLLSCNPGLSGKGCGVGDALNAIHELRCGYHLTGNPWRRSSSRKTLTYVDITQLHGPRNPQYSQNSCIVGLRIKLFGLRIKLLSVVNLRHNVLTWACTSFVFRNASTTHPSSLSIRL